MYIICYCVLREQIITRTRIVNWASQIRNMLFSLGFGEAWFYQGVGNIDIFLYLFKQRVRDIYCQNWHDDISNSTRARTYSLIRNDFYHRKYLDVVTSTEHMKALARLLTSSHRLRVETGRWDRPTPTFYTERKCLICNRNDIEDEFHFTLICPAYDTLRKKYLSKYFWFRPNMIKFQALMNSDCDKTIIALAKFVHSAFKQRKALCV